MNTSFPSAASDFGAFFAGGNQPNANANLKGIFAALGCAKNGGPDSVSGTKSNFDAILDESPAVSAGAASLANQTTAGGEISDGETASPASDCGQLGLAGRFGAVVTTTLQIKGMVAAGCAERSMPQTVIPAEAAVGNQTPVAPDGIQSDQNAASADSAAQTLNPDTPGTAVTAQSDSDPVKETGTGPTLLRQIKMLPGRGQSSRGRGWNPALVVHTDTRVKSPTPNPTDSAAVKPLLPATDDSAPTVNSLSAPTSDTAVTAIIPVLPLQELQAVTLNTADDIVQTTLADPSAAEIPTSTSSMPAPLENDPVISLTSEPCTEPQVVGPVVGNTIVSNIPSSDPAATLTSSVTSEVTTSVTSEVASPSIAVSTPVPITPSLPVQATQGSAMATDVFSPVVESVATVSEDSDDLSAQVEKAPTESELRRDVAETVAAMLAPFLTTLPAVLPESLSNAFVTLSGDAAATGQANANNPTITVKIGTQPPFEFELAPSDFSQGTINDLTADSQTSDASADVVAASMPSIASRIFSDSDQASILLPMAASLLATEAQPLDFRIQIKTKIDAAWQQSNQPGAAVSSVASPEAAVVGADPIALGSLPSAANQQPASKPTASPVEIMIKLPGLGTMTAQIVATDAGTNVLEKKSMIRSGRMEKTAGNFRPDGISREQENTRPEKTFLNAGEQPVKGRVENAGTGVAISGDTMPERFTSRRVTVDQLQLPVRFDGREIQPVLNGSQDFTVAGDAPVSSTPAPVLAHRAVETILNVVDAQRQSSANASSVNLHFKFGGDDLAVRVHMRGGEVLTQFITDSVELRSALSSEWQIVAGQGNASALRLHEPVIIPASTGTSSGFGSASQGQNHSQQNSPQQHAQSAEVMHELRELRRGAPFTTPSAAPAPTTPGTPVAQPSSRLLAATA